MSTDEGIEARVRELVAEGCAVDLAAVRLDRSLIDLGIDSARAIDLIVALEDAFGLTIKDAEAAKLRTVSDIVSFVAAKLPR